MQGIFNPTPISPILFQSLMRRLGQRGGKEVRWLYILAQRTRHVLISVNLAIVPPTVRITATATDPSNNASEFSIVPDRVLLYGQPDRGH